MRNQQVASSCIHLQAPIHMKAFVSGEVPYPDLAPKGDREAQFVQYVTHTGSLLALTPAVVAQLKPCGRIATRLLWPWLLAALIVIGLTPTPTTLGEARPARWRSAHVRLDIGPAISTMQTAIRHHNYDWLRSKLQIVVTAQRYQEKPTLCILPDRNELHSW